MKKALKITGIIFAVLVVGMFAYLSITTVTNNAAPAAEALAAMESDERVTVEFDDYLTLSPASGTPTTGIVFYAGAHCDVRGYTPVLKEAAALGYLVVAPTLPFDFAIFAPNKADEVRAAHPEIEQWIIAGHSMGGAMVGTYADSNRDNLAGMIVFDSHPPASNNLSEVDFPVLLFERARLDGSRSQKFIDNQYLYPESAELVLIPGAQHMYYGSFDGGSYQEEWEPGIDREVMQQVVIDDIKKWLAKNFP
ncbi:MAG: alpha/beta hydrolase [Gammaproteobacteria bacterium]